MPRPIERSRLRLLCGRLWYTLLRYALWYFGGIRFARRRPAPECRCLHFAHRTPLLRKLRAVDMRYQHNKIVNLRIAAARLDGVVLRPGETLSYWRLIGRPTRRKGYLDGIVLFCGTFRPGVGGGLCQLSNLLFWMTLHTPLTVVERYRHSYDVFPDSGRTQPFGSGAPCDYPSRSATTLRPPSGSASRWAGSSSRGSGWPTVRRSTPTAWSSATTASAASGGAVTAATTRSTARSTTLRGTASTCSPSRATTR